MIRLGRSGNGVGYDRFIVISIGTGSNKSEKKYNAKMVAKWGALTWLFNSGSTPIIDCFNEASTDMVDYHNSVLFTALQSQDNYLRIQVSNYSIRSKMQVKMGQYKLMYLI